MGSDGTASPTERDGSNAKKRFSQGDAANAEALASLEAGVLKLERDSPTGAGGLYASIGNEIEARMPLRARLQELATFLAWFALIASCTIQYPMVWVAFWNHVEALRERMYSFHRRSVSFPLWGLWVAVLFCYRRMIYRRAAPDLGALLLHAEVFACVVLCMTGELPRLLRACSPFSLGSYFPFATVYTPVVPIEREVQGVDAASIDNRSSTEAFFFLSFGYLSNSLARSHGSI